jgi:hypothetical protein
MDSDPSFSDWRSDRDAGAVVFSSAASALKLSSIFDSKASDSRIRVSDSPAAAATSTFTSAATSMRSMASRFVSVCFPTRAWIRLSVRRSAA